MLVAANLGGAALNARAHHWLFAVSYLIWTVNLLAIISTGRSMQRTRDEVRLVRSAIHAMREEIED
jgi:hypothetical protein